MKQYKSNIDKLSLVREKTDFCKAKIASSKDAYDYMIKLWDHDITIYESFFLLLLNRINNTIGYVKVSQGGVAGTVVDNKIILKYAIESLASCIIVAHNHPSGNLKPSQEDINITKKLKDACAMMDIAFFDHIIVGEDKYFSFGDEGML